jgi:hypothetical protein
VIARAWVSVTVGLLLSLAAFCAPLGSYFAWKFFTIDLPNKRSVNECLPSGGTCSIDGVSNLELLGGLMAFFLGIALALLVAAFAVFGTAGSSE